MITPYFDSCWVQNVIFVLAQKLECCIQYMMTAWHSNILCITEYSCGKPASTDLYQTQIKPISNRSLQWRHNGCDSVSNHQPYDCLLNRIFGRRSKKTSKLRVTGLCARNSAGTGDFPAQMVSNAENVSIWWCHPDLRVSCSHYNVIVVFMPPYFNCQGLFIHSARIEIYFIYYVTYCLLTHPLRHVPAFLIW